MPSIMLYQAVRIQTKMQLSNIRTSSCKAKLLSQLNVEVCVASEILKYFSRQPLRQGLRQAAT